MKLLKKAVCALALTASVVIPAQAEEKVILMGTIAYEDTLPITGITKKVLEDQGYTVKLTQFTEWGIAFAALNKGDVQILASQTDYVSQDYWNKNKSRLEKISPVSHGLYQGVGVPSYVPINSLEELNANAEKFGGKIVGIEPGSGLMREANQALESYSIRLKLLEGSTAAMTAAVKSAVDRKEWIAATVWDPTWFYQKYDLKFLADPKGIFAPPQANYWLGRKGFSAENPRAREVIASVFVPLNDVRSINSAVKDGKTMDEAVKEWTDNHADLLKRWENIKQY